MRILLQPMVLRPSCVTLGSIRPRTQPANVLADLSPDLPKTARLTRESRYLCYVLQRQQPEPGRFSLSVLRRQDPFARGR